MYEIQIVIRLEIPAVSMSICNEMVTSEIMRWNKIDYDILFYIASASQKSNLSGDSYSSQVGPLYT